MQEVRANGDRPAQASQQRANWYYQPVCVVRIYLQMYEDEIGYEEEGPNSLDITSKFSSTPVFLA